MNEIQRNLVKQINYERKEDYRTATEIEILQNHPEIDCVDDLNFYLEREGLYPYEVTPNEEEELWESILRNIDYYEEHGTSIHFPIFSNL